jgi:inorganic pyrophosphatase
MLACLPAVIGAQVSEKPSNELPGVATAALHKSLEAAGGHATHVWRDTPPTTADGDVNAYVEIPRGDRRKWEFDMRANARAIDRVMPADVGGYPVNYGFVPQTVSYDGDPFDVLVLGPPLPGGRIVRGRIVGLMIMEDEKGADSKVVVSPIGPAGKPIHQLTDAEKNRIAEYFRRYKQHDPKTFSRVPGWGEASDGRAHVDVTHAFFLRCRARADTACRLN